MKVCLVFLVVILFSGMAYSLLPLRPLSLETEAFEELAAVYSETPCHDAVYKEPAKEKYKEDGVVDLFERAEAVTGIPAEILRGIASAESDFRRTVIGDYGYSLGMFQLHSDWHESRAAKWGDFDPFNPYEAAIIAGRILAHNLAAFDGDWRKAIAAYRQGVTGVRQNGATCWYVDRVLNWRECYNRMMSFFVFSRTSATGEKPASRTAAQLALHFDCH